MARSLRIASFLTASALLFVAPLVGAQDRGTDKPAERPAAQGEKARAENASAAQQRVSLPVSGLTAENAEKASAGLAAISHTQWTCPGCKYVGDQRGQCAPCKKDLVSEEHKCLANVRADAAAGTLTAVLNPGARVKLSEVERALGGASVKLDPAKLALAGHTKLVVQGPGDAAAAKKLEEGLKAAKLFDSVEIKHDADSREYVIAAQAGAEAPTHAAASAAIARAGGDGFKLVDVVWIGPKRVS